VKGGAPTAKKVWRRGGGRGRKSVTELRIHRRKREKGGVLGKGKTGGDLSVLAREKQKKKRGEKGSEKKETLDSLSSFSTSDRKGKMQGRREYCRHYPRREARERLWGKINCFCPSRDKGGSLGKKKKKRESRRTKSLPSLYSIRGGGKRRPGREKKGKEVTSFFISAKSICAM